MNADILIVDDDIDTCELVQELLASRAGKVAGATSVDEAIRALDAHEFDVVLTDLDMGKESGLAVCEHLRKTQPEIPAIVLTGHGSLAAATDAIRAGAYDFITKPIDASVLMVAVERALEHRRVHAELRELKVQLEREQRPGELVGQSALMQRVYSLVQRVKDTPASVLIAGESGTGKELVARALHFGTPRGSRPFVAINCAAVPAALLESELFGHVKGAFTDARSSRPGLFLQASGGTVFLDEIGEMPLEMQAKLLRVLQERTVRPVGGDQDVPIDVRVVAATNRDLEREVERGNFREDLYYRLNVVQINLPPLRARGNDILLIATHFLSQAAERLGRSVSGFTGEAAQLLLDYDWPGNVRQLQNCVERAVTLTRFERIAPVDLPDKIRKYTPQVTASVDADPEYVLPLDVMERRYIEKVLKMTGDNKSQAARLLGLDRRTLYRKLERFERAAGAVDREAEN
ncbi:MAG TPA: sigma-54 dependent transcriptional regulator [Polyangiaceae bacterium]|nr:sigma-54 dependent transcriptional regulator [Polyangiaceae bacterium]